MQDDLTADAALQAIASARAEARQLGLRLSFAVVDGGGNDLAVLRDDDAQLGSLSLARDKAFTAVSFGVRTSSWAGSSKPGESDWGMAGTLGGRAIVFPGGVPLYRSGRLLGAIGVSGTVSTVDEVCALAGVAGIGFQDRA